jgi:hypothetical protein
MKRADVWAAALLVLGCSAHEASALTIPYSDDFNSITTSQLNKAPTGWTEVDGTVDSIKSGTYGITCFSGSGGCVGLGGSTEQAGYLTSGTFNLVAGQTYRLSAEISGNHHGDDANNVIFGFFNTSDLVLASKTVKGIASSSPFTLYSMLFTPTTAVTAEVFFHDASGDDDQGPILDDVRVAAVPLPAAAWLLLSGLAALGAVARRRISAASRASNLPAPGVKFAGDGPSLAPRARLH